MPGEKDTQIESTDGTPVAQNPKEYIANLGQDMVAKSQAEMDRANTEVQQGSVFRNEGEQQVQVAEELENLEENVVNTTAVVASSAEEVSEFEYGKTDVEKILDQIEDLAEGVVDIKNKLEGSLSEEVKELIKKNPEAQKLGEEIQKLYSKIEKISQVKESLEQSKVVLQELPDEILLPLETISDEAKKIREKGEENLRKANWREAKDREIAHNAQRNIESLQKTLGRTPSEDQYNLTRKLSGPEGVKQLEKFYNTSTHKKVEERITQDMQEQGKSQEEIEKSIANAKARINKAIEDEKTGAINPSSGTMPLP